jgi:sulfite reductase (NADPH) flavoprotein alpha-component
VTQTNSLAPSKSVASVCPYCGVGCGLVMEVADNRVIKLSGNKNHPANFGRLCTKGSTSHQVLNHTGRLDKAYVRQNRAQSPVPTPMAEAIAHTASELNRIRATYGPGAISFYVSGQMSTEAQYLANKLAKGYIGTNLIESNSRLCMASAGAGYKLSLGSDAPPGSYQDFEATNLFLVIGSNMADCHPILYLRMMERVKAGAKLIVVDPRRTTTADKADLFLHIKPGTDLALLNGLLYLLHKAGATDADFIAQYTDGWEQVEAMLDDYTPEAVSAVTGLSPQDIQTAAALIGAAPEFMTCWTMGLNQSTHGTWNTNAICNLHLATGKICRPGSGPFSLTGQPNAMGGREMGYMGPGLPGQRSLLVDSERAEVEAIWQLPPGTLTTQLGKGTIDLFEQMAAGVVKACWIICTNPVASVPNRQKVIEGLQAAELVIAQDAFLDTETNIYADVLLPGALWAEAEGTMINSERNITLMQQAVLPPGKAMADWRIIAEVAKAMGFAQGFNFSSAEEVFEEIKRFHNPQTGWDLRGVSFKRLREEPLQWPMPEQQISSRSPVRYINDGRSQTLKRDTNGNLPALVFATNSGKAQFLARPHLAPAEMPCLEFPLMLNTGRVQHQWHTLTKTGKIATLNKLNPGTFIEINPQDAQLLGINNKDSVQISSRRGSAVLPAVITDRVVQGSCFAPIHWNDVFGENLCINAVTSDYVDPISQQPELKICAVALQKITLINTLDITDSTPDASELGRFAQSIAIAPRATPAFNEPEQWYLSGLLEGLKNAPATAEVPVIPASAPFSAEKRYWLDGLLAGLFSRTASAFVAPGVQGPSIGVLFGSQTGNAEALAQTCAAQLKNQGWHVALASMDDYNSAQLAEQQYLVFIASTFGDGDAPDNAQNFWHFINSVAAPQLHHLKFAVLALGDSNYDQFCGYGKKLDARLLDLGGEHLLARVECDSDYQNNFDHWLENLTAVLAEVKPSGEASADISPALKNPINTSAATPFSKNNPYAARLVTNQKLNAAGSNKDVRLFGFSLGDGISYEAGDALGVMPKNDPALVQALLDQVKLPADVSVAVPKVGEMSLAHALIHHYEIGKPHPDTLKFIAQQSSNRELDARLKADKNDLKTWLYGRQLIDLLREFPVSASADQWLEQLKKLQPRLYSIASSPKAFSDQVQLCVSAVRYQFNQQQHLGISSCYLADRAADDEIPIYLQPNKHFKLPKDHGLPIIMIGPGTGVAPFRGFLQERQALGAAGKNWLFFGEQQKAYDYYFAEELHAIKEQGYLHKLSLAFSRDQAEKIYVQNRIEEEAGELWHWLNEGAHIYVCGDASRMAKDVDTALINVIARQGAMSHDRAVEELRALADQKRYLRDVY